MNYLSKIYVLQSWEFYTQHRRDGLIMIFKKDQELRCIHNDWPQSVTQRACSMEQNELVSLDQSQRKYLRTVFSN